jgi:HK97 family phage prohead protease
MPAQTKELTKETLLRNLEGRTIYRELNFRADSGSINDEEISVDIVISTETPVLRYDWWEDRYFEEVLLHGEENIDLSRLTSLFFNHRTSDLPIGRLENIRIEDRKLKAKAYFDDDDDSLRIWKKVKSGSLTGISVGYRIHEIKLTKRDGQPDLLEVIRWTPLEASIVTIPADHNAGVGRKEPNLNSNIEKPKKEDRQMPTDAKESKKTQEPQVDIEKIRQEALEAERQRVKQINELCRMHGLDELAADLVERGVSVEEAKDEILKKLAERKQPVGGSVRQEADEREKFQRAVVDAVLLRAGFKLDKPAEGANQFRGHTLVDLAKESLRMAGVNTTGWSRAKIVERAFTHSSSDFPNILLDVANKALTQGYREQPVTYKKFTRETSATDFKANHRVRISSFTDLEEVKELAEYKEGSIRDEGETVKVATFGKIFTISRQAIINDDLDALSRIPAAMGRAARRTIEKTVYALINANPKLSDGKAVFSTAHGNLGTAGAISDTSLKEARQMFMKQKDANGNLIQVKPEFLLIPSALYVDAYRWMNSAYLPGATNEEPNPFKGYVNEIIESEYLSADFNGSDTAWYLFANPNVVDTIEVAFLDGNDTPEIVQEEGFSVDGIRTKVRIDFGAAFIDYRGVFKNPGA